MSKADLPAWVYGLVLGVMGYEDVHDSGDRCLSEALRPVPAEVLATVSAIRHLAIHEPEALAAIVAAERRGL